MAIPSRQIGGSTTTNLLWQISKQLEELICVRAGGCGTTTTTTTVAPTTTTTTTLDCNCYTLINNTNNSSSYDYIDCSGSEINNVPIASGETINLCASRDSISCVDVILILDQGVCGEVCNYSCNIYKVEAPEVPGAEWNYSYVDCEGIFVQGVIGTGDRSLTDCMVVGSLTYFPEGLIVTNLGECLVNATNIFVNCPEACNPGPSCQQPYDYYNVWMTQSCIDSWPTIGCEVWLDEFKTTAFPDGNYNNGEGECITITGGVVTAIP